MGRNFRIFRSAFVVCASNSPHSCILIKYCADWYCVQGCIPIILPTITIASLCYHPPIITGNQTPPRMARAGLNEYSILHHFLSGISPQFVRLDSQIMIQIVSGTTLSVNNMEPTVAMFMIECIARGRWIYWNSQQEVFEFTGVSCKQGIPTRPDNYRFINRHLMK